MINIEVNWFMKKRGKQNEWIDKKSNNKKIFLLKINRKIKRINILNKREKIICFFYFVYSCKEKI